MINLSVDEIAFLEKIDKERKQHAEAQKKYRNRKAHEDPQYKEKLREYMKVIMQKSRINTQKLKRNY